MLHSYVYSTINKSSMSMSMSMSMSLIQFRPCASSSLLRVPPLTYRGTTIR